MWVPKDGSRPRQASLHSAATQKLVRRVEEVEAANRLDGFEKRNGGILGAMEKQWSSNSTSALHRAAHFLWHANFDPTGRMHVYWDVLVLVLVIYSCLAAPFRSAYAEPAPMTGVEVVVDVLFYIDIVVVFCTGYDKGYEVIYDKKVQARAYVGSGWFVVDLVATVQWEYFMPYIWNPCKFGQARFGAASQPWWRLDCDAPAAGLQTAQGPNFVDGTFLRMSRMVKVLRLVKVGRLIDRLTSH